MSSSDIYHKTVVRVEVDRLQIDWKLPFQRQNVRVVIGTGFFFDEKGHILTCAHVVEGAYRVLVQIPWKGTKMHVAKIKGVCPNFDIAVLQIENYKHEHFLKLGKNIQIDQGMEATAVGYPLGSQTLKFSKGIVSGKQGLCYQIDTSLNPGNSGGPLIYNEYVIGINAAGEENAESINYAVPINKFYLIEKLLVRKQRKLVHYPLIFGFEQMQRTTVEFKKYLKNRCEIGGVYINNVIQNTLISKTKLKKGDILCKLYILCMLNL